MRRLFRYVGRAAGAAALVAVVGCAERSGGADPEPDPGAGPVDPGTGPVDPGMVPGTDPATGRFSAIMDGLQPGWLLTTTRLTDGSAPTELTQVSDGSPIMLTGAASDVFVAMATDGDGKLMVMQSMGSPCTMARSHQRRVPADYATIQAAIDAAQPGDTVAVARGVYTEAVQMRPGICLLGAGAQQTVLDAQQRSVTLVDLTSAPGSVVAGFTFRGVTMPPGCASTDPFECSGDWYRAGVFIGGTNWLDPTQDAPPLIADNIFADNDVGLMLSWRGVAVVHNNLFLGNRSGLVANHFQSRTLVANNVFFGNRDLAIGNQSAYLDLIENVIAQSRVGVRFEFVQTGFIRCNVFFENRANQASPYVDDTRFTIGEDGNIEIDPRFADPGAGDFHLQAGSPAIDHGCSSGHEPDGSPHDIGAYGGPLAGWVAL